MTHFKNSLLHNSLTQDNNGLIAFMLSEINSLADHAGLLLPLKYSLTESVLLLMEELTLFSLQKTWYLVTLKILAAVEDG